jgi:hypothetical protein
LWVARRLVAGGAVTSRCGPVLDVDGVVVEGDGEDFAGVVAADLDALAGDHDAAAAGDDPAGERRFLAEARRRTRSLAVRL